MEDDIVVIADLKVGQKVIVDIANHEVELTKLDEAGAFNMEEWYPDETKVYIMESQIEEDEPLHYAFEPMTLEEGQARNAGKFGKDLVMMDFLGREVEGIEMEEEEDEPEAEQEAPAEEAADSEGESE